MLDFDPANARPMLQADRKENVDMGSFIVVTVAAAGGAFSLEAHLPKTAQSLIGSRRKWCRNIRPHPAGNWRPNANTSQPANGNRWKSEPSVLCTKIRKYVRPF
jgi:hypothetical protein